MARKKARGAAMHLVAAFVIVAAAVGAVVAQSSTASPLDDAESYAVATFQVGLVLTSVNEDGSVTRANATRALFFEYDELSAWQRASLVPLTTEAPLSPCDACPSALATAASHAGSDASACRLDYWYESASASCKYGGIKCEGKNSFDYQRGRCVPNANARPAPFGSSADVLPPPGDPCSGPANDVCKNGRCGPGAVWDVAKKWCVCRPGQEWYVTSDGKTWYCKAPPRLYDLKVPFVVGLDARSIASDIDLTVAIKGYPTDKYHGSAYDAREWTRRFTFPSNGGTPQSGDFRWTGVTAPDFDQSAFELTVAASATDLRGNDVYSNATTRLNVGEDLQAKAYKLTIAGASGSGDETRPFTLALAPKEDDP